MELFLKKKKIEQLKYLKKLKIKIIIIIKMKNKHFQILFMNLLKETRDICKKYFIWLII